MHVCEKKKKKKMSVSSPSSVFPHGLACVKCGVACTYDAWCVCESETDHPKALAAYEDSPWEALTPAGFGRPRQCSFLEIGNNGRSPGARGTSARCRDSLRPFNI